MKLETEESKVLEARERLERAKETARRLIRKDLDGGTLTREERAEFKEARRVLLSVGSGRTGR